MYEVLNICKIIIHSNPNSHSLLRIWRFKYIYIYLVVPTLKFRFRIVLLLRKTICQCCSILAQTDIAVKSKQSSNSKEYKSSKNHQSYNSPFVILPSNQLIPNKDPNTLHHNIYIIQSIHTEQSEKRLVILSSNTVI